MKLFSASGYIINSVDAPATQTALREMRRGQALKSASCANSSLSRIEQAAAFCFSEAC